MLYLCILLILTAVPAQGGGLHQDFDALLARYVADAGVRYEAWAGDEEDRQRLDDYVRALQQVEAQTLGRDEAMAFWINLYNAATLRLVLDHYPVASIRDLGDESATPWQRKLVTVEGRELTLDEIEHEILRPTFEDARIHFALSCAARGCPPLRPEAFTRERLQEQLREATHAIVHDPRFVKVECRDGDGGIYLSPIFEWYAEDFARDFDSVHYFLADRRADRLVILRERCELIYNKYDWSLNAATEEP